MSEEKCACRDFDELRGASVNNYIAAFLEKDDTAQNRFVCRICGTRWEKQKQDDATKAVLIKIGETANEQGK